MPNDQKNINVLNANQHADQKGRRTPADNVLSVWVWTISGIVLAACGGGSRPTEFVRVGGEGTGVGGGTSGTGPRGPALPDQYANRITVTDGPIEGAQVWVDVNGNGVIDPDTDFLLGETNGAGQVDFPAKYHGQAIIVKLEDEDGNPATDTATDQPVSGEWRSLPSDNDGTVVVSPLTNLIAREGENAQEVLDEIFGKDAEGESVISLDDVLNPENYNPLRAQQEAELISRAALALTRLAENGNLDNNGDPADADALDKVKKLFEPFRAAIGDDDETNDEFTDDLLTDGTLKGDIGQQVNNVKARPVIIDPNEGDPIEGTEDEAISLRDLTPELEGGGLTRQQAAEVLFGFRDPLGQENEKPGIEGVYIKAESNTIMVSLSGGATAKKVLVMLRDDDGDIISLSATSSSQRGADPAPSGRPGSDFYYVSLVNLHKLVFVADGDAHGDFEVDFHVFDGEEVSKAPGKLELKVASVNDIPTDLAITGDRDTVADDDVTEFVLSPQGRLVLGDNTFGGVISVTDIETALSDFTFRVEGEHGGLFTVNQENPNAPFLERTGEKLTAGESYSITLVAVDADGGEVSIEMEILEGGFYLEDANNVRSYNNDDDALMLEGLNPQSETPAVPREIVTDAVKATYEFTFESGEILRLTAKTAGEGGNQLSLTLDVDASHSISGRNLDAKQVEIRIPESGRTLESIKQVFGTANDFDIEIVKVPVTAVAATTLDLEGETRVGHLVFDAADGVEAGTTIAVVIDATDTGNTVSFSSVPNTGEGATGKAITIMVGSGATWEDIVAQWRGTNAEGTADLSTVSTANVLITEDMTFTLNGGANEIFGYDLGAIGVEGGVAAILEGEGVREFFLTDDAANADFRIKEVGGVQHLFYTGSNAGDFEAGDTLSVTLGIRFAGDGIDATGDGSDDDYRVFTGDIELSQTPDNQQELTVSAGTVTPFELAAITYSETVLTLSGESGSVILHDLDGDGTWEVAAISDDALAARTDNYFVLATYTKGEDTPATANTLDAGGLTLTATQAGANSGGISFSITADSNLDGADDLVVVTVTGSVTGSAIAVTYGATATLQMVLEALAANEDASALVTAALTTEDTEETAVTNVASMDLGGGTDAVPNYDVETNDETPGTSPVVTQEFIINIGNVDDNDPVAGETVLADGVTAYSPPEASLQSQPVGYYIDIQGIRFRPIDPADDVSAFSIEVLASGGPPQGSVFPKPGSPNHLSILFPSVETITQQSIVDLFNKDDDVNTRFVAEIIEVIEGNLVNNRNENGEAYIYQARSFGDQKGDASINLTDNDTSAGGQLQDADGNDLKGSGTVAQSHSSRSDDDAFRTAHGLGADDEYWAYEGTYGTLVLKADGSFSYVLNTASTATTALTETTNDEFFVTATDSGGTDRPVKIVVPVNVGAGEAEAVSIGDLDAIADHHLQVDEDHAAGGALFTVPVTDADTPDTITYALASALNAEGDDVSAMFVIDPATGEVRLADGQSFDHETGFNFLFTIEATSTSKLPSDYAGAAPRAAQTVTKTFSLVVNDVNEAPTAISISNNVVDLPDGTIPQPNDDPDGNPATDDATLGGYKVADLTVTDEDAGDTHTWSISGDDAAAFEIRDGNQLWLKPDADVLNPGEKWSITLTATDKAGLSFDREEEITLNGLFVTRADITDDNGDEVNVYTDGQALIPEEVEVDGVTVDFDDSDDNLFVQIDIDGTMTKAYLVGRLGHHLSTDQFTTSTEGFKIINSRELYFTGDSGDFEDGDTHEVDITATWTDGDGTPQTRDYTFTINLENQNDNAPTFSEPLAGAGASFEGIASDGITKLDGSDTNPYRITGLEENLATGAEGLIVFTPVTSDVDDGGDTVRYSLTPGVEDNNLFIIDAETGAIRFRDGAANFERPSSKMNGVYKVKITATNTESDLPGQIDDSDVQDLASTQTIEIVLGNVNEAPTAIFLDQPAITKTDPATSILKALDPDQDGDASDQAGFTFITVADDGEGESTDTALFTVNAAGELEFTGDESARKGLGQLYQVRVQVTDTAKTGADGGPLTYTQVLEIAEGSVSIKAGGAKASGILRGIIEIETIIKTAASNGIIIGIEGGSDIRQTDQGNWLIGVVDESGARRTGQDIVDIINNNPLLNAFTARLTDPESELERVAEHADLGSGADAAAAIPEVVGVKASHERGGIVFTAKEAGVAGNSIEIQFLTSSGHTGAPTVGSVGNRVVITHAGTATTLQAFIDVINGSAATITAELATGKLGTDPWGGTSGATQSFTGGVDAAAAVPAVDLATATATARGILFEADDPGAAGNDIAVNFTTDGALQNGAVRIGVSGNTITVFFNANVPHRPTMQQVIDAINADAAASALVDASVAPVVIPGTFDPATLSGGEDGTGRFSGFVDQAGEGLLEENADGSTTPVDLGLISAGEGKTVSLAVAGDVAGETDTSLYDNALFRIDNAGNLLFEGTDSGDFEAGDRLTVRLKITDGTETTYETYQIRLSDTNDAPEFMVSNKAGELPEVIDAPTETPEAYIAEEAASVTINGVKFTALQPGVAGNDFDIQFTQKDVTAVSFDSESNLFKIAINAATQASIVAMITGNSDTNTRIKAEIVEAMTGLSFSDWRTPNEGTPSPASDFTDGVDGQGIGVTNTRSSSDTTAADLAVTEGSDTSATGYLKIAGADGTVLFGTEGQDGAVVTGTGSARTTTYTGNFGTLTINSDGSWTYTADESLEAFKALATGEITTDRFIVRITDTGTDNAVGGGDDTATHHVIDITINGEDDQILDNPIPITEGDDQYVMLTEDMLPVTDQDAGDNVDGSPIGAMIYTVTAPQNGAVQKQAADDGTWSNVNSFTLQELRDGLIRFLHDGGEQFETDADGYKSATLRPTQITLTIADDESATSDPLTVALVVTPVNDAPVLDNNTGATLDEGAAHTFDETMLKITDVDNTRGEVIYRIVTAVEHGAVELNGVALGVGDTFTQQDIADGSVVYQHDGSENFADRFVFAADDGNEDNSDPIAATVSLTITPVNDAPIQVAFDAMDAGQQKDYTAQGGAEANPIGDNTVGRADIAEGGRYVFTALDMGVFDPDHENADVMYTLTTLPVADGLSEVTIEWQGTEGDDNTWAAASAGHTFTLEDLKAGRLRAVHNGGEPSGDPFTLAYSYTDGEGTPVTASVEIEPKPVNDAPTLISFSKARIDPDLTLNSEVGSFSTTDEETTDQTGFTYRFVDADGNDAPDQGDARFFTIEGNTLKFRDTLPDDLLQKIDGETYEIRVEVTDRATDGTEDGGKTPKSLIQTITLPVRFFDIDWNPATTGSNNIDQAPTDLTYDLASDTGDVAVGTFIILPSDANANDQYEVELIADGNDFITAATVTAGTKDGTGARYTIAITPDATNPLLRELAADETLVVSFTMLVRYRSNDADDVTYWSQSTETFSVLFHGRNDAPEVQPQNIVREDADRGTETDQSDNSEGAKSNGQWVFEDPDSGDMIQAQGLLASHGATSTPNAVNLIVDQEATGFDATSEASVRGVYGSLWVKADGTWEYRADDRIEGAPITGATETFRLQVRDGLAELSAIQEITITVRGENDTPVLGLNKTPGVAASTETDNADVNVAVKESADSHTKAETEDADGREEDEITFDLTTAGEQKVTGRWAAEDVDAGAELRFFVGAVNLGTIDADRTFHGLYGDLVLKADGTWEYLVRARAEEIAHEETPRETFVITIRDQYDEASDPVTLQIEVTGLNDAPVDITGHTGTVTESGFRIDSRLDFTVTVDNKDDLPNPARLPYAEVDDAVLNPLPRLRSDRETDRTTDKWVDEDGNDVAGTHQITGTLDAVDVDRIASSGRPGAIDEHTFEIVDAVNSDTIQGLDDPDSVGDLNPRDATDQTPDVTTTLEGTYGTLTLNKYTGAWVYNLDNTDDDTNALSGSNGEDRFWIRVTDEEGATIWREVVITIEATDDAPILLLKTAIDLEVDEAGGTNNAVRGDKGATASGQLHIRDTDSGGPGFGLPISVGITNNLNNPDSLSPISVVNGGEKIFGKYGYVVFGGDYVWDYKLYDEGTSKDGVTDSDIIARIDAGLVALNALDEDDTVTETAQFKFTNNAFSNVQPTNTVTVEFTITGTNDAPVLSVASSEESILNEDGTIRPTSASVTLDYNDVDDEDTNAILTFSYGVTSVDSNVRPDILTAAQMTLETTTAGEVPASIAGDYGVFSFTRDDATGTLTVTYNVAQTVGGLVTQVMVDRVQALNTDITNGGRGIDQLSILVNDGDLNSAVRVFRAVIDGENDAPMITLAGASITDVENTPANQPTASGDFAVTDVDNHEQEGGTRAPTYSIETGTGADAATVTGDASSGYTVTVGGQTWGTINLDAASGAWTFTANAAQLNTLDKDITQTLALYGVVTDAAGAEDRAEFTITLTGANDHPVITLNNPNIVVNDAEDDRANPMEVPDSANTLDASVTDADANDSEGNDITYSIAGTDGTTVGSESSSRYEISKGGETWGNLVFNPVTGQYHFEPEQGAEGPINALADGQSVTLNLRMTATDGHGGTGDLDFTITINGANDAPTISVSGADMTVIEDSDAAANGSYTLADPDTVQGLPDVQVRAHGQSNSWNTADSSANGGKGTQITGTYGDLYIKEDGTWTYELDNSRTATQALTGTEENQETFFFRANDGSLTSADQRLDISVIGANDAPTIVEVSGADKTAKEAGGGNAGNGASGRYTLADVDNTPNLQARAGTSGTFNAAVNTGKGMEVAGTYGSLFIKSDGSWTYEVNNSNTAVEALNDGQSLQDTFTLRAWDGTAGSASTETLTITIQGTTDNRAPVISTTETITALVENQAYAAGHMVYTARATDSDPGDTITWSLKNNPRDYVINQNGQVSLKTALTFNYESIPGDQPGVRDGISTSFTVVATDSNGASSEHRVTIPVTNVPDDPVITFVGTGTATPPTGLTVPENDGNFARFKIEDEDTGDYSASDFTLTATEQQSAFSVNFVRKTGLAIIEIDHFFNIAYTGLDYESIIDSNKQITLTLTIPVISGKTSTAITKTIVVTVTNLDDAPTGSLSGSPFSTDKAVGTAVTFTDGVTDQDGDAATDARVYKFYTHTTNGLSTVAQVESTGTELTGVTGTYTSGTVGFTTTAAMLEKHVYVVMEHTDAGGRKTKHVHDLGRMDIGDQQASAVELGDISTVDSNGVHTVTADMYFASTNDRDRDFFKFTLTERQDVKITLKSGPSSATVWLYNAATSSGIADDSNLGIDRSITQTLGAGTYLVSFESSTLAGYSGAYSFTYEATTPPPAVTNTGDLTGIAVYEGDPGVDAEGDFDFSTADAARVASYAASTGTYGTFTIDSSTGTWAYQVDNSDAAVVALNSGDDDLTETITVTVTYDTDKTFTQDVTFTINGRTALANPSPNDENTLTGTTADEIIRGYDLDDIITSGGGNDLIAGGYGDDTITLGAGSQTVAYRFMSGSTSRADDGGDIINAFKRGEDKLVLLDTSNSPIDLEGMLNAAKAPDTADNYIFSLLGTVTGYTGLAITFGSPTKKDGPDGVAGNAGGKLSINFADGETLTFLELTGILGTGNIDIASARLKSGALSLVKINQLFGDQLDGALDVMSIDADLDVPLDIM